MSKTTKQAELTDAQEFLRAIGRHRLYAPIKLDSTFFELTPEEKAKQDEYVKLHHLPF